MMIRSSSILAFFYRKSHVRSRSGKGAKNLRVKYFATLGRHKTKFVLITLKNMSHDSAVVVVNWDLKQLTANYF